MARFRKRHARLTPEQSDRIVRLRDVERLTWKDVGRALQLQDDVVKRIYAQAKSTPAAELATAGHMAPRGHAE